MNNNLLLYVHFNRNNALSDHVIYQLTHLRQNLMRFSLSQIVRWTKVIYRH